MVAATNIEPTAQAPCARVAQLLNAFCFQMECRSDCLNILRGIIETTGALIDADKQASNRMLLALDELMANIWHHGYHDQQGSAEIEVEIRRYTNTETNAKTNDSIEVCFQLRDFATPITNAAFLRPAPPCQDAATIQPGHLGLFLIHTIMDSVQHQPLADGNRWLMHYSLPSKPNLRSGK
ncbi:MAG: ATP-binding protein [Mariprofundales bacterium]